MKPMTAPNTSVKVDEIDYPVYVTPKIDGVRCAQVDGVAKGRSLKPIKNKFIQSELKDLENGPDGELTVGLDFNKSSGDIRRESGEPDFVYWVFDDYTNPNDSYLERIKRFSRYEDHPRVQVLKPAKVDCAEQMQALLGSYLDAGHEGAMVRSAEGLYKFGRATLKQGWLLKVKDFTDAEAEIIGYYEQMHNANEAKTNELGRTQRSTHKENMVPTGRLGGFILRSPDWDDFRCGSFKDVTKEQRKTMWDNRKSYIGELAKYKYQMHGCLNKPRIPIFLGIRDRDDMDAE